MSIMKWIDSNGDGVPDGFTMDLDGNGVADFISDNSNRSFVADTDGDGIMDIGSYTDGFIPNTVEDFNQDGHWGALSVLDTQDL